MSTNGMENALYITMNILKYIPLLALIFLLNLSLARANTMSSCFSFYGMIPILTKAYNSLNGGKFDYHFNYLKVKFNPARKNIKPTPRPGEFWEFQGKLVLVTAVEKLDRSRSLYIQLDGINASGFQWKYAPNAIFPNEINVGKQDLDSIDFWPVVIPYKIINSRSLKVGAIQTDQLKMERRFFSELIPGDVIEIDGQLLIFKEARMPYNTEIDKDLGLLEMWILETRVLESDGSEGKPMKNRFYGKPYSRNVNKAVDFLRKVDIEK